MSKSIKTHPSFGTVCVTRSHSGHDRSMFMSTIGHNTVIKFQVRSAKREWNNGGTSCFPQKVKMEFHLTEIQFAQLLSNVGNGEGTPCTIIADHTGRVEECPEDSTATEIEDNIKGAVHKSVEKMGELHSYLTKLRDQPRVTKKELDQAIEMSRMAYMSLSDSLPFYLQRAKEILTETVGDAQAQIMGFLQTRAKQLGVNPSQLNPFRKLMGKKEES